MINNQTVVELPITIVHYDPVSRKIVEPLRVSQRDLEFLVKSYNPTEFFDVGYVYAPAWKP